MHQLFDACSRTGYRQILQQSAELHDKRNLARRKDLADDHRRNQRQRYKHIGLDIKRCHQSDDCFQNDRDSAQDNRDPRRIHTERLQMKNTCQKRNGRKHQQRDVLLRSSPLEKLL